MRQKVLIGAGLAAAVLLSCVGAAMAGEAGKTEQVEYFYWFIWPGGGVIGVMLLLVNLASWEIIIRHFVTIRRANVLPDPVLAQIRQLAEERKYREMIDYTAGQPSALAYVVHRSLCQAQHGYAAMERAMEEAAEERTTKLLRKIELLNVIGNVSPMMGLLGTVYGMIMAFSKIVQTGGMPEAGQLAGSIGIALVTTFWGLFVAIPALAVYAVMRNRIDALSSETMTVAQETIGPLRPAVKKSPDGA